MNNPITENLPADLPEDWVLDDILAPDGTYVGLTERHGYNYLMAAVNAAQRAAKQLGEALAAAKASDFGAIPSAEKGQADGVAELDSSGKVPSAQLPAMDYDPAGSADAVQQALNTHTSNKQNPHGVKAAQVGAYTKAQTLQAATSALYGLGPDAVPDDVFKAIVEVAVYLESGSYVGTGKYGESNKTTITLEHAPVFVLIRDDNMSFNGGLSAQSYAFWCKGVSFDVLNGASDKRFWFLNKKTLSWYATNNASDQLNYAGEKYFWVALTK